MSKKVFSKTSRWICIILGLLFFSLFSVIGETPVDNKVDNYHPVSMDAIQFFTNDFIIELEHTLKLNSWEIKNKIENQILIFLQSYEYYKDLNNLFKENINLTSWKLQNVATKELSAVNTRLLDIIDANLRNLDKNKYLLFRNIKISPEHFYSFGNQCYRSFITVNLGSESFNTEEELMLFLLSTGLTLKSRTKNFDTLADNQLRIKGVYLNWQFVNQEYIFTGGPGGLPVPPDQTEAPYSGANWYWSANQTYDFTRQILKDYISNPGKTPVDVYILDTIPGPEKITHAYQFYYPINYLVKEILDAQGRLFHIIPYVTTDYNFDTLSNEKYCNRDMSDHGIYIAGIIRRFAPFAELHLLETLNQYGSGTLDSLLWGFQKIIQEQQQKTTPFIINCSLTTKIIPYKDYFTRYKNIKDCTGSCTIPAIFYTLDQHAIFFPALTTVINFLHTYNCAVAAAAGNDSSKFPGYPACLADDPAYDHVIAVGACNRIGEKSSFSNFPGNKGILAYGGEIFSNGITQEGMDSLYFTSVYSGINVINKTGWARWAGSSFSTGIVSGLMAALLTQGTLTVPIARNILINSCRLNSQNMKFLPIF